MLPFPSNVSKFNRFRLIPIDSTNPDNVGIFAIIAARDTIPQLVGMASLTFDPNMWAGTPEVADEMAEYFMNNAAITELCDAVANCIESSPAVAQALRNVTLGDGLSPTVESGNETVLPAYLAEPARTAEQPCDTSSVYGTIVAVLSDMAQSVLDFLERIRAITYTARRVSELLDAVPSAKYGATALTVAADVADALANIVYTQYEASLTSGIIEDIACDVLCYIDSCEFTVGDLRDALKDQLIWTISDLSDMLEVLDRIAEAYLGTLTDKRKVLYGIMIMMEAIARDSVFNGIIGGIRTVEQLFQLHADETNDNWSILCGGCGLDGEWLHTIDFTAGSGGFALTQNQYGEYVATVGWQTQQPFTARRLEWLERTTSAPYRQTRIKLIYDTPASISSNDMSIRLKRADDTLIEWLTFNDFPSGTDKYVESNGDFSDVSRIEIAMYFMGSAEGVLKKLQIEGRGTNPFI